MSDIAIKLVDIGKQYHIGAIEPYQTLRDTIVTGFKGPFRRLSGKLSGNSPNLNRGEYIWALKHVSLEIMRGEVIGVIGHNGAGKTTLLKILSRITKPTRGYAEINGRVVSLLEVGTGFHAELTGRENIFLNGAILGMRRTEITRKFDEIVAFAEVERFLDTPVKRYSSGMYMRLAFAVAAHLDPEILLVDEVLAVGDATFQKKCLGKMGDVARKGRTVLFVSHNMGAIRQLCPQALWMDHGLLRQKGDTEEIVDAYVAATSPRSGGGTVNFAEDIEKDSQLRAVRLLNGKGELAQTFSCDSPVIVELDYQIHRQSSGLFGCFTVSKEDGTVVLFSYSHDQPPNPLDCLPVGLHTLRVGIPARSLGHGSYQIKFSTGRGRTGKVVVDDPGVICRFSLDDLATLMGNRRPGYFSTLLNWEVRSSIETVVDGSAVL